MSDQTFKHMSSTAHYIEARRLLDAVGGSVMVSVPRNTTREMADRIKARLAEIYPEIHVAVVSEDIMIGSGQLLAAAQVHATLALVQQDAGA